jgi:hypothetical protein
MCGIVGAVSASPVDKNLKAKMRRFNKRFTAFRNDGVVTSAPSRKEHGIYLAACWEGPNWRLGFVTLQWTEGIVQRIKQLRVRISVRYWKHVEMIEAPKPADCYLVALKCTRH